MVILPYVPNQRSLIRHSFWSISIGGVFGMWGSVYSVNQSMVQRYFSCKSVKEAQKAIYLNVVGLLIILDIFAPK